MITRCTTRSRFMLHPKAPPTPTHAPAGARGPRRGASPWVPREPHSLSPTSSWLGLWRQCRRRVFTCSVASASSRAIPGTVVRSCRRPPLIRAGSARHRLQATSSSCPWVEKTMATPRIARHHDTGGRGCCATSFLPIRTRALAAGDRCDGWKPEPPRRLSTACYASTGWSREHRRHLATTGTIGCQASGIVGRRWHHWLPGSRSGSLGDGAVKAFGRTRRETCTPRVRTGSRRTTANRVQAKSRWVGPSGPGALDLAPTRRRRRRPPGRPRPFRTHPGIRASSSLGAATNRRPRSGPLCSAQPTSRLPARIAKNGTPCADWVLTRVLGGNGIARQPSPRSPPESDRLRASLADFWRVFRS